MTSPWFTPLRGSGHDGEKMDVRTLIGRQYEVRYYDKKLGRDMPVGSFRSEAEARDAANGCDGVVWDHRGIDRVIFFSKGYKRRTGMGRGGMGGRPEMQPQISDRPEMAGELDWDGSVEDWRDW